MTHQQVPKSECEANRASAATLGSIAWNRGRPITFVDSDDKVGAMYSCLVAKLHLATKAFPDDRCRLALEIAPHIPRGVPFDAECSVDAALSQNPLMAS